MKKLISFIIILTINSCYLSRDNGIEMKINNESNDALTNVTFTTSEKLEVVKIDRIDPNESVAEYLSMRKNKGDGSYLLTFIRTDGKQEKRSVGYYTNGGSLNQWVNFIVKKDTTLVNFDPPAY